MADTKPSEVKPEDKAPAPVVPEAKPEGDRIPKERLDQEIAKRKTLEDSLVQRDAEIAALKSSKPADAKPAQPAVDDDIRKSVQRLEALAQRQQLVNELGLRSDAEVAKVQEVMKTHPSLAPADAVLLAKRDNAELFGGTDQRAFNPGQHGSLRPAGTGVPAPVSLKERSQAIAKLQMTDPIAGDKAAKDLHGELLRNVLKQAPGWS